jgi:hypothetical protein
VSRWCPSKLFENDDTRTLSVILDYLFSYGFASQNTLVPYQAHLVGTDPLDNVGKFAVITVAEGMVVLRNSYSVVFKQPLSDPKALELILAEVQRFYRFGLYSRMEG